MARKYKLSSGFRVAIASLSAFLINSSRVMLLNEEPSFVSSGIALPIAWTSSMILALSVGMFRDVCFGFLVPKNR